MKKTIDKAKLENVEWFLRFTLLDRIRIARKNMQRARKFRGLALKKVRDGRLTFKDLDDIEHLEIIRQESRDRIS